MNPLKQYVPTRERLIEFVRTNAERCRQWLVDDPAESWRPKLLVLARKFTPQGPEIVGEEMLSVALLIGDFNDEKEKYAMMRRVGQEFQSQKILPLAACLVSECWRTSRQDVQARDDPDREEGLVIVASTVDGKATIMGWIPVTRLRDRMILGEIDIPENQDVKAAILTAFFGGFGMSLRQSVAERN
jgi:hypothetical protein